MVPPCHHDSHTGTTAATKLPANRKPHPLYHMEQGQRGDTFRGEGNHWQQWYSGNQQCTFVWWRELFLSGEKQYWVRHCQHRGDSSRSVNGSVGAVKDYFGRSFVPYNIPSLRHIVFLSLCCERRAGRRLSHFSKEKKRSPFPGPNPNPNWYTKP